LRIADCGLRIADCGLRIVKSEATNRIPISRDELGDAKSRRAGADFRIPFCGHEPDH
jgi:hypothetical protein